MFKTLLQKALAFVKLYDEKRDIGILIDCEHIPEYKELVQALDLFTLKDLCLDEKAITNSFIPDHICASTILETPNISIGYFFIPAGMSISLHDHPNMLVTSKILKGEVRRRALDLIDKEKQLELPLNEVFDIEDHPFAEIRLDAIVEADNIFKEGEMVNLTPVRGNIHSFTAITDTIIFDILTPYYDQETRFCNFYLEVDNIKPNKVVKKVKKEVSAEAKYKQGYKTTLVYLYTPPKINVKVMPCSEKILD